MSDPGPAAVPRPWMGPAQRLLPLALVAVAVTQCAVLGWGRYGELMVDTGRELEWPRRLLNGETLYADLRFNYGPLDPYLNALWYALFGVKLEVLAVAGTATALAAALTLYALARSFVGRLGATVVALTFVYTCAFSHYGPLGIFNWVLPHTFASTYGMLAALLSLFFLNRLERGGERWNGNLSSAFLGLAALAKVECFFPALVAHGVWLLLTQNARRRRAVLWSDGVAAAGVVAVYSIFYLRAGPALWTDNVAGVMNPGSDYFIRFMMGFDDIPGNGTRMVIGVALLGCAVAAIACAATLARRFASARLAPAIAVAPVAVVLMMLAGLARMEEPDLLFRAMPVLVAAVAATLLWIAVDSLEARARWLSDMLVWSFAAASLPRIILRPTFEFYGYFLLPSAILALGVFLFGYVPRLARVERIGRAATSLAATVLMLGTAAVAYQFTLGFMALKTVSLTYPRGRMIIRPEVAEMFVPVLQMVSRYPPSTKLLVLPEASAINFLTEHPGVDGLFSHLPMDYYGGFTEDAIIAQWERSPPNLILFHDVRMRAFGDAQYCRTYGVKSCKWMTAHYVPLTPPNEDAVLLAPRTRPATGR